MSQSLGGRATILYPTIDPAAREARIEIRDPFGAERAIVGLRPVNLLKFENLIRQSRVTTRERMAYARALAFGDEN